MLPPKTPEIVFATGWGSDRAARQTSKMECRKGRRLGASRSSTMTCKDKCSTSYAYERPWQPTRSASAGRRLHPGGPICPSTQPIRPNRSKGLHKDRITRVRPRRQNSSWVRTRRKVLTQGKQQDVKPMLLKKTTGVSSEGGTPSRTMNETLLKLHSRQLVSTVTAMP